MYHPTPFLTFFQWAWMFGLMLFTTFLLADLGLLGDLLISDVTRISAAAMLIFVLASLHCGYRSWWLSREFVALDQLRGSQAFSLKQPLTVSTAGLCRDYLSALGPDDAENAIAAEVLAERAKGNHQLGWFVSGVLVKLGLLGTVVGFIMMLGSVSGLENLDTSDIKELMQQMTEGMGVAMNTTLVGLVCSVLLGAQYLLLDRAADRLVVETLGYGQRLQQPEYQNKTGGQVF